MEEVALSLRNSELGRQDAIKATFTKIYLVLLREADARMTRNVKEFVEMMTIEKLFVPSAMKKIELVKLDDEIKQIEAEFEKQNGVLVIKSAEFQKQMSEMEMECAVLKRNMERILLEKIQERYRRRILLN